MKCTLFCCEQWHQGQFWHPAALAPGIAFWRVDISATQVQVSSLGSSCADNHTTPVPPPLAPTAVIMQIIMQISGQWSYCVHAGRQAAHHAVYQC
jgi:hypothetical protein